jgi:hypothetical protein
MTVVEYDGDFVNNQIFLEGLNWIQGNAGFPGPGDDGKNIASKQYAIFLHEAGSGRIVGGTHTTFCRPADADDEGKNPVDDNGATVLDMFPDEMDADFLGSNPGKWQDIRARIQSPNNISLPDNAKLITIKFDAVDPIETKIDWEEGETTDVFVVSHYSIYLLGNNVAGNSLPQNSDRIITKALQQVQTVNKKNQFRFAEVTITVNMSTETA